MPLRDPRELAQDGVARLMAELVVRPLEVVEIEQRDAERALARRELVEPLVERAPVEQAGEPVAARLGARVEEQSLARDGSRGEVRDGVYDLDVDGEEQRLRHRDE